MPRLSKSVDSPRALRTLARVSNETSVFTAFSRSAIVVAILLTSRLAAAQADPKYVFAKPEPISPVQWKAQAKAGALVSTGNSQARSAALGLSASRKEGANKLAIEGGAAYGRATVYQPTIDNTDPAKPLITDLGPVSVTTTNNWLAKGRYDRFFTANNTGYVSGQAAADRIAGKTFFGGGQLGYSRQLVADAMNLLVAEIGYDYSYESYVQQPGKTIDAVSVHSARLFVGEALKLSPATGITASVEALFNVNREGKALNHTNGAPGVDAFADTRVVGKAALTTTVWKALSIAFGFTLRYDENPAPLPIPPTAPKGAVYSPTTYAATMGVPFARTVDTLTEATLIYTFL
jgi:hypothetical protein